MYTSLAILSITHPSSQLATLMRMHQRYLRIKSQAIPNLINIYPCISSVTDANYSGLVLTPAKLPPVEDSSLLSGGKMHGLPSAPRPHIHSSNHSGALGKRCELSPVLFTIPHNRWPPRVISIPNCA
jgi:hypothetical protein